MKSINEVKSLSTTRRNELLSCYAWDTIVHYMDDDVREKLHIKYAPCSEEKFLKEYVVAHYRKFKQWFDIN